MKLANESGVYLVRLGNSSYVGSAVNLANRKSSHLSQLRKGKHPNDRMQAAWDGDGGLSFSFRVVVYCSPEDLLSFEQVCIDGMDPDINICPIAGNSRGVVRSVKTREKLRQAHLGRKLPWEQIEAIRKSLFGRPVSEETRAKLARQKGWKHSDEAKAKMRGRVVREETRQVHRERMLGSAMHTTPHSEETKRRISEANRGRVLSEETRQRMRDAHARRKAARLS